MSSDNLTFIKEQTDVRFKFCDVKRMVLIDDSYEVLDVCEGFEGLYDLCNLIHLTPTTFYPRLLYLKVGVNIYFFGEMSDDVLIWNFRMSNYHIVVFLLICMLPLFPKANYRI